MSEVVKGAVGIWKGLDKKVYSRVEVVENTNKNGVVSTRTYAINDQNGKRKQVKNIHRGDAESQNQAEMAFLEGRGVSSEYQIEVAKPIGVWHAGGDEGTDWEVLGVAGEETDEKSGDKYLRLITRTYEAEYGVSRAQIHNSYAKADEVEIFPANQAHPEPKVVNSNTSKDNDSSVVLAKNKAMLKEWERQVQDRGLRGKKGFAEAVNELNDEDYQPIKFYETLLANDPDAGRAFAWEYGIVKQPEPASISRDSVVYNEIGIAGSDKNEQETPDPESQSEVVEPVTVDPSEVVVEGLKKSRWQRVKDAPKMTMAKAHNGAFNILDRLAPKTVNLKKNGENRRAIGRKTAIIGALALSAVGVYAYQRYWGGDIPKNVQDKINGLVDTNSNLTVQHQLDQDTINGLNSKVRGLQERLNDLTSQHSGHGSGGNHGMDQIPSGGGSSNSPEIPNSSSSGEGSVTSLNLRKEMPWTVAHQVTPGNETSSISKAMSEYGRMSGTSVKFGQYNGETMIFVNGRIVDTNQMEEINKIIVSLG